LHVVEGIVELFDQRCAFSSLCSSISRSRSDVTFFARRGSARELALRAVDFFEFGCKHILG